MKFIELTTKHIGDSVFINMANVVSMWHDKENSCTILRLAIPAHIDGGPDPFIIVKETPDHILARC